MSAEFDNISFDMPKTQSNAIKVIGVGGGSNAVNHMYSKQIHGVDFVICNTDAQALENSPIPNKIQLGAHLTSGLGAGANPEIGAQAAAESIQEIQQMLSTHTKMVFITAGMGRYWYWCRSYHCENRKRYGHLNGRYCYHAVPI